MKLEEFFSRHTEIAVAFSGGVDSSYLLYAAKKHAKKAKAYYVKTQFQPEFEFEDARRMAAQLEAPMKVIEADILSDPAVKSNPEDRCYYCKKRIFGAIIESAAADGFTCIADGTNASDDASDRPGMRALAELSVYSPLRLCGLTKGVIRQMAKEAGLFTWDKSAYACLATRITTGEEITNEKLFATEEAENYLFSLGFKDFRVRSADNNARIQLRSSDIPRLLEERRTIADKLKKYYKTVSLDLEVRDEK